MTAARILVVDDEPAILRAMQLALRSQQYDVVVAATGPQAVAKVSAEALDLVLLDLGLPGHDGIEVIRQVRGMGLDVPIVVLSAWQDLDVKVRALDLGADGYVEKPFAMPELLARVRAVLRGRAAPSAGTGARSGTDDDRIVAGDVVLERSARTVRVGGSPVDFTRTQFDLLAYAMRHPRRVLTHRAIALAVWGPDHDVDPANLRMVVSQVRRRIEREPSDPQLLRTIVGIGYRFDPPVDGSDT